MLATVHDPARLIGVCLHVDESLTEAEVRELIDLIGRQAAAIAARPDARPVSLIVVETDNAPDARQRRRIGEAARMLTRGTEVLVTPSTAVRMVMTAIRWFSPANPDHQQQCFAKYDEARAWLVAHTAHSGETYDKLLLEARARAKGSQRGAAR